MKIPLALAAYLLAGALFWLLGPGSGSGRGTLGPDRKASGRVPVYPEPSPADVSPPPLPPAVPGRALPPSASPPGLVQIAGGRFQIGADTEEICALIESTGFRALASETPRHAVQLADFYLMPTEVTNEQFARFVEATGSGPPRSWG